jgi:hypothetical protein
MCFFQYPRGICSEYSRFVHGEGFRRETTIGMLPDDVLLEIFDFYRKYVFRRFVCFVWPWHRPVHVCRRWRQLIFDSPRRLNLEILCTEKNTSRERLCIWPAFPIVIRPSLILRSLGPEGEENVIAALGHPDRVCYVTLRATHSELKKVVRLMQKPFPVLTHLTIFSSSSNGPVVPSGLLGGSAPRLKEFALSYVPFPALPTFLISTSNLVTLYLSGIPPTGYIPPEAMAVGLAPLTKLKALTISFQSVSFHPDDIHPPHVTRVVLPALTSFTFRGACAYLENLVTRIDSPQLDQSHINYSDQPLDVPVAQLAKFLDRSIGPKLALFRHAQVRFFNNFFAFAVHRHPLLGGRISCTGINLQVSNIAHSFHRFSSTLSNLVHLKLVVEPKEGRQLEGTDDLEWLVLLRQFSTIQSLYVSHDLAKPIALALENVSVEMVAEFLPSLDLIYFEGRPASSVEKFVAARQLSGRPVTVVDTKTEFDDRLESSVGK